MAREAVAGNRSVGFTLRALQIVLAIIVMGTNGYAIHLFHSHTDLVHTDFGDFYETYGVPNSWGFLMFCAGWTVLVVIFLLIAGVRFAHNSLIGYVRVAVEALTLLAWFAGFIAVAVEIGTDACPARSCGSLKAATVFGALEWLLFSVTTTLTIMLVFSGTRRPKTATTSPAIAI